MTLTERIAMLEALAMVEHIRETTITAYGQ